MARMRVEVVLALPGEQQIRDIELPAGGTALDAARAAGMDGEGVALGVAGRRVPPDHALSEGDRVEVLRPLAADPKEARRRRARARPRR